MVHVLVCSSSQGLDKGSCLRDHTLMVQIAYVQILLLSVSTGSRSHNT